MCCNNKTRKWLDALDESTKAKYMEKAMAHASEILKYYRDKMSAIKKKQWEMLQQKQREKASKEDKRVAAHVKLTNEVAAQGGIWCTEEIVEKKYDEMVSSNKTDEDIRRAIYTQLMFHQKV